MQRRKFSPVSKIEAVRLIKERGASVTQASLMRYVAIIGRPKKYGTI